MGQGEERVRVCLRGEGAPLSLDDAVRFVGGATSSGAIATFSGVVRDNSGGRQTSHLEYEAYEPMALREMRAICEGILGGEAGRNAEDGGGGDAPAASIDRVYMAHRTGRLTIGEPAVVIAVSAPHSAEAIDATRTAIDELKLRVPIWKKECFVDGQVWKSNRP